MKIAGSRMTREWFEMWINFQQTTKYTKSGSGFRRKLFYVLGGFYLDLRQECYIKTAYIEFISTRIIMHCVAHNALQSLHRCRAIESIHSALRTHCNTTSARLLVVS
jgi:hypothetical protein